MTLLDIFFIAGVVVATGSFNFAITILSKLCKKPFYQISQTEIVSFLSKEGAGDEEAKEIRKYRIFVFIASVGALIGLLSGLIQVIVEN